MSTESDLELETLRSLARDLKAEIKSLQRQVQQNTIAQNARMEAFTERVKELESLRSKVQNLEDVPGVRTPRWYVVDIDFTYGATSPQFNSTQISADGPFICTQIQPYYLVTDTNYLHYQGDFGGTPNPNPIAAPLAAGRYLPCTASVVLSNSLKTLPVFAATGAPGFSNAANTLEKGPLRDFPEFSFQIQVAGSGTFWTQNRTVPAAAFYGFTEPLYTGVQGFVERTDRIVVYANPETPIPLDGRVRMVFHGYQILGDVKIAQMLGY